MDDRNQFNRPYDAYFRRPGESGGAERERPGTLSGRSSGHAVGRSRRGRSRGRRGHFRASAGRSGRRNGSRGNRRRRGGLRGRIAGRRFGGFSGASGLETGVLLLVRAVPLRSERGGVRYPEAGQERIRIAGADRVRCAAQAGRDGADLDGPRRESGAVRGWRPWPGFWAGILLTGTLMFAADRMNLFTGGSDQALSQNSPGAGHPAEGTRTFASDAGIPVGSGMAFVRQRGRRRRPAARCRTRSIRSDRTTSRRSSNGRVARRREDRNLCAVARARSGNTLFDDPFFRQFFGDCYASRRMTAAECGWCRRPRVRLHFRQGRLHPDEPARDRRRG